MAGFLANLEKSPTPRSNCNSNSPNKILKDEVCDKCIEENNISDNINVNETSDKI